MRMSLRGWILLLGVGLAGCHPGGAPTLHILTWPNYFAQTTQADFEKEFGCRIKIDYVENSEDYRTKLAGGKSGFDVVVPSDEVVADLAARGLLERLDLARLPNLKNIAPAYRSLAYDPKNEYSVPYMWGTTGIAYNTEQVKPPPDSWGALWDPRYAKRVTLLNDKREVFAAALRLDGAASGSPLAPALKAAQKRFEAWKPQAYESDPKEKLVNGDAWIAQCYNGDALQAASGSGGKIAFVIPKEGGTRWVDNLSIAKGAPEAVRAHQFIDYLLRPEVSAAITNERFFGNPNEPARKLIKKEVLENRVAFPSPDDEKRLSLLPVLSPDEKAQLDTSWAWLRGR